MSPNEWNIIKRLAAVVLVIALFPIGAFAYRFFADESAGLSAPTATPALFTLVPNAGPGIFSTPKPTSVIVVVPNGWTEYAVPDGGFAIAVPTTWQRLPVKPQELDASLQIIRQGNPELAAALGAHGEELMRNGVKFWAFDPDPDSLKSKFATNLTVTRRALPNPVSFDAYVLVNLNQINALASRQGQVTHQRATLATLPAEKIRYDLVSTVEDGTQVTSAITLYLMLNRSEAYVLIFATRPEQVEQYAASFDQSAASFRLVGQ